MWNDVHNIMKYKICTSYWNAFLFVLLGGYKNILLSSP